MLAIAASDLAGDHPLEAVTAALSNLADACVEAALREAAAPAELGVIAMGKFGARELNYVSDIDLMFVTDGDVRAAARSAESVLGCLGAFAPEGRAYMVDLNLRPEGRNGALVRSLDSYLEYYTRWAQPWEFQALIKARAAAGNRSVGQALVDSTRPLVFPEKITAERIAAVRAIKERIERHATKKHGSRRASDWLDVKLGRGGIRDVEFSVQLLQLVHGGADPSLRSPATLDAIDRLTRGGYVADQDGRGLASAYRWLRSVEHRLQLANERRVVRLPEKAAGQRALAHAMGFDDSPAAAAYDKFEAAHRRVVVDVRARFERLFYRPMIESLADTAGIRMSADALRERLRVLGFRDTDRAAQTLHDLVSGTSRRAALFRVLSPAFLRFVSDSPLPDDGLFSFLRLGDALGGRVDVLGALRENPPGLHLLAQVLGSGRVPGEILLHVPEELQSLAEERSSVRATDPRRVVEEARATLQWRQPQKRWDGLRRFKRRRLLQIIVSDIAGETTSIDTGVALSNLADACIEAALPSQRPPFAVIAMGKLGGRELGYSSDIDVMFVHDGDQGAAEKIAEELLKALGEVTAEGQVFRVDAALRPEGKAGPLSRSVDSYVRYYERWAQPWEYLALLKARCAAGDEDLAAQLWQQTRAFAFPEKVDAWTLREIRHLKARMERERIPRGTSARRNLKFGPGGMADIEFACQLLQMRHGHEIAALRVGSTLRALHAGRSAGLLDEATVGPLEEAYVLLYRLRNRMFLMTGRPSDVLSSKPEALEALGIALGFTEQPRQQLEEEYLRLTRRARRAVEPLIYG